MSSRAPSVQPSISFPALVQAFFTHYLVEQRALSPRTVAGYPTTHRLDHVHSV